MEPVQLPDPLAIGAVTQMTALGRISSNFNVPVAVLGDTVAAKVLNWPGSAGSPLDGDAMVTVTVLLGVGVVVVDGVVVPFALPLVTVRPAAPCRAPAESTSEIECAPAVVPEGMVKLHELSAFPPLIAQPVAVMAD